jgi:hypothetical protein
VGDLSQFQALLAELQTRTRFNVPPFLNRAIRGTGGDIGVQGEGSSWGVYGRGVPDAFGNPVSGVYGKCETLAGTGVSGVGGPNGAGVRGSSDGNYADGVSGSGGAYGDGVRGSGGAYGDGVVGSVGGPGTKPASAINAGVIGTARQLSGNGVIGEANNGANAIGVWGRSTSGYAGRFDGRMLVVGQSTFFGDVQVFGQMNKDAVAFKIDHPLAPETKYLLHSGVESPDMKNIYDGTCRLDKDGSASVELPEWFGELNRDYRYQLTAIGGPAPDLHIAEEISENRFRIAGGTAETSVSWQVTGIRKDAWAESNRIVVEEDKLEEARGTYLHPEAFGQPETRGEAYAREAEVSARAAELRSRQEERMARKERLAREEEEFRERVARLETERPGRPEGEEEP